MVDAQTVQNVQTVAERLAQLREWEADVLQALRRNDLSRGDQIGYRAQMVRVQRRIAMLTEAET
jgi:hypothetical protein